MKNTIACSKDKDAQNNTDAIYKRPSTAIYPQNRECPDDSFCFLRKSFETGRGVGKTAIEVIGSMGEVTVSFDDRKTGLQAIKTAISDFGLGAE